MRFGSIRVGTGTMEVKGIENVRGRAAYHTVFRVTQDELYANLHSVLDYLDEPFADVPAWGAEQA